MGLRAPTSRRSALPHKERLERSFGQSLAGVEVHTGAGRGLESIGADAATDGSRIAFASHTPDLRTTAHEVAHVLQNRQASGAAPGGIAPAHAPAEADASRAAQAVVQGAPAQVSAAPGGELQLNRVKKLFNKLRGKTPEPAPTPSAPFRLDGGTGNNWRVGDQDKDKGKATVVGTGGSLNRVDRVTYDKGVGATGEKLGFFKPFGGKDEHGAQQGYSPEAGNKAIAATRLDDLLGFGLLPKEYMAEHGGEMGTVSPKVSGGSLYEPRFDQDVDTGGLTHDAWKEKNWTRTVKAVDGELKEMSGVDIAWHDFTNPRTQRGLADLQLFDAIVGQVDRHGGNIYIDDATGQVHGIDNDQILESGWDDVTAPDKHYLGLPSLVSEGTAERVLKMDVNSLLGQLANQMRWAGAGALTPEVEKRFEARLTAVKTYLQQLKDDDKLIPDDAWGDDTYAMAMAEDEWDNGIAGSWHRTSVRSYVKRAELLYAEALQGIGPNVALPKPKPKQEPIHRKRNFGTVPQNVAANWGRPLPPTPQSRKGKEKVGVG